METVALAKSLGVQESNIALITSAKGKVLGAKMALSSTGKSFKDCRAAVRAANPDLKGDKLTKAVNDVYFGNTSVAVIAGRAAFEREIQAGKVPNVYTTRNRSASLTFIAPTEAAARGAKVDKSIKALAGIELNAEQRRQLEAILAKKDEASGTVVEV